MDYVVLETESRGRKLRAVVHLFEFFSALISERAWRDRWHGGDTVPHSPLGLVLGSLESGVSTVLEEAGCRRDFVKTLGNDSAALSLAVLELRGKPVSPLSHGMWSPPSLNTLKIDSNIGNKKTACQMNMGIYTCTSGANGRTVGWRYNS